MLGTITRLVAKVLMNPQIRGFLQKCTILQICKAGDDRLVFMLGQYTPNEIHTMIHELQRMIPQAQLTKAGDESPVLTVFVDAKTVKEVTQNVRREK